jgi:hypothetical protein
VLQRGRHESLYERTGAVVESIARRAVQLYRIHDGSPHIMLALPVPRIFEPDRSRTVIALKVIEGLLQQVALATHPVHDLQLVRDLGEVRLEADPQVRGQGQARPTRSIMQYSAVVRPVMESLT